MRAKRPKLTEKELAGPVKELELNPRQSPFSNKTDLTLRKVYEEDHTLLEKRKHQRLTFGHSGEPGTSGDSLQLRELLTLGGRLLTFGPGPQPPQGILP